MPAGRSQPTETGAKPPGPRRPPWVKEGPQPIPMPTAPWTLNKRGSVSKESEAPPTDALPPRKSSTVKITPVAPSENGASKDPHTFERPQLRSTKPPPKEQKLQSREVKVPVALNKRDSKDSPSKVHIDKKKDDQSDDEEEEEEGRRRNSWLPKVELKPVVIEQKKREEVQLPKVELKKVPKKDVEAIDKAMPSERNAIVRQESLRRVCPAPPPMPPPPPPPEVPFDKRDPLSRSQLEKLESLRARPRKRPDWGEMMKEVEKGRKLRHVQCNDRSQPLLPQNTVKGQFIYESEKANLHNQLLKQIQTGAQLKHVKTNDRSRPILEGLRKFRRQMTIEEQIQKSQSMASMPPEEVQEEVDEMDDIDKVRDDLQSTKQMLALELRNKEAQIRENKRLLSRLQSLEAEVERMKAEAAPESATKTPSSGGADDKVVKSLKDEVVTAKKNAEVMEKKYHDTADQLDSAKNELDEARKQNRELEKKLQQAMQGMIQKRQSFSDRRESVPKPPESEEEDFEPESEESDGEETEEKKHRRAEREIRLMRNKLKGLKNKQEAAKKERKNLRDLIKKNQHAMKDEKKKFKNLQKEVNKMAALMKDDEDEDEEDEEEEEESEEEESETESESESSEEEEESESEVEDFPYDKKKDDLLHRTKRHENCLNALKKGNYMLKANVDRIQDDLNKQKEAVQSLQEDLDSVLAELG